jgi:hypothetical protein
MPAKPHIYPDNDDSGNRIWACIGEIRRYDGGEEYVLAEGKTPLEAQLNWGKKAIVSHYAL